MTALGLGASLLLPVYAMIEHPDSALLREGRNRRIIREKRDARDAVEGAWKCRESMESFPGVPT